MSASRKRLAVALVFCLLVAPACARSESPADGTDGSQTNGTESPSETISVTAERGASFAHEGDSGHVAAVVLPGTFPAGTELTFTVLETGASDALGPGLRIEASNGSRPAAPVLVAFQIPGQLPEDAAVFAYSDEGDEGEEVIAATDASARSTSIVALVPHLTTLRVEERGDRERPAPSQTGWIDLDGSAPFQGELAETGWDSTFSLTGRLTDSGGGLFVGPVEFAFMGEYDNPGVYGMASAAWKGPMEFDRLQIRFAGDDVAPEAGSSVTASWFDSLQEPIVIRASGRFTAVESEPFWAWVETEGLAGQRVPVEVEQSIFPAGTVDCSLWLTAGGVFVWVSDPPQADVVPAGPFAGSMVLP